MTADDRLTEIQARVDAAFDCRMCKGAGYYEMLADDWNPMSLTKYECNACARSRPLADDATWLLSELSRLRAELATAEQQIETLVECDCVSAPISSKGCRKCGRRGVVSHDFWLRIVKDSNELPAVRAELATAREAIRQYVDADARYMRRIDTSDLRVALEADG